MRLRLTRSSVRPGAAGYRILWRDAWGPDWQHDMFVGNVNEYVLPHANIDDAVFGVAAVDANGHESTVSAYVAAPQRTELAGERPRHNGANAICMRRGFPLGRSRILR